jgi:aldehyde:ferredoxin oxidoreductase
LGALLLKVWTPDISHEKTVQTIRDLTPYQRFLLDSVFNYGKKKHLSANCRSGFFTGVRQLFYSIFYRKKERKKRRILKANCSTRRTTMLYGYKGKLLHVDLTRQSFRAISLPEEILEKYIGGRGLGAKLYWDLIPSDIDPLGQENIFMVLSGPLSGTMAPGVGKHLLVTKSPTTGGWLESYSSGRIAPEIKFAGFDGLLITGKAKNPVCLLIQDEAVEFRDAANLWGQGSFSTERYAKDHFHRDCGVLSIGPAGENLLKFACVGSEFFRKAGRGGAGAVMGSKNLKLIAVKGSGGVPCADIQAVYDLVLKHYQKFRLSPVGSARHRYGTPLTLNITNEAGMLPTRNFSRGQYERALGKIDKDGVEALTVSDRACYACFMSCSKRTRVDAGPYKGLELEGPEYETLALMGPNLEVHYLPAIMKANRLCDDLGMDTISAGVSIGFAMECFERGILTEKDTGGLKLRFGNYEAALELLELMAYRKGFGAFCAQGVEEMAKTLGRNTEDFAMHCKGMEMPGYDPRAAWGASLTYAVTPRGACHRRAWPPSKEVLGEAYPFTTEGKAELIRELMNENCVMHSLIVCDMGGKFIPLTVQDFTDYLNAVTGSKYSTGEMFERAEMIETLIRRVNIREGIGSDKDVLPKRILEESHPEGPTKGRIIGTENFLRMREAYYLIRGWDRSGVPTPETVHKYGLEEGPQISLRAG